MGLGVSLILIAAGAIMAWAVNVDTTGFNIHTVGYILLVVGIIGALLSLIFWSSWQGPGTSRGASASSTTGTSERPRRPFAGRASGPARSFA